MPTSPVETPPRGGAASLPEDGTRELLRAALEETRARTLLLVERVDERDLDRAHDPLMSPLAWDLGHIAAFEDLWLCQRAGGLEPLRPELAHVYDPTETPRPGRVGLAYLRSAEARAFMEAVRRRALGVLEDADLSEGGDRLNAGGFVWEMVVQHEQQHNETMLQALQIAPPGVYAARRQPVSQAAGGDGRAASAGSVRVEEGAFPLGDASPGFSYDNERPQHPVELAAFEIDRTPVTNRAYREFVEAGGYGRREWWSEDGWAWRRSHDVEHPLYWTDDGRVRRFERTEELEPDLPVMHVSFHEADAYARAHGKRLPTEAEWEKAASWDAAGGTKRRYPWGDEPPTPERANLDQAAFGPAAVDAYPAGASPCGALAMIGDAWEWTASDFAGYPGFSAFPYREYSEAFFAGRYKVLRGGSWATRPRAIRNTFRNWDFPERRQIFAGFRCAA